MTAGHLYDVANPAIQHAYTSGYEQGHEAGVNRALGISIEDAVRLNGEKTVREFWAYRDGANARREERR